MFMSLWTPIHCSFSLFLYQEKQFKMLSAFYFNAFDILGPCKILKTNNGLAYTTKPFQEICHQCAITHITGIPYTPSGSIFVERGNEQLKYYLKVKREVWLLLIIFYLRFYIL